MANVPFDIEGARKAGASDAKINNFLGQKLGFDVAGAREAGASDEAILETLLKGPATKQVTPPPSSTGEAGFSAKDTAIALGQSVLGAGKSFTDVAGANNPVSQTLGAAVNKLQEQYTPERKAEMQRRAQLQEEASKSGDIVKEISTFLGGITEAPIQSLAQGLGSVVPYIGTGVVGAVAKLGGPTLTAINTLMGFVQGAGSVKGSLYDNVKQELEKNGMSSREAEAKASKAQEYLGANFLDIAGGAVLGGVGARYGVENLLQKGAAQKLNANLIPRVVTAAAAEAPLEGLQGGQEQLAVNRALQKEGIKVGTLEGVFGSAARDAALGALTAGAVGVRGPSGVSNEQLKKDLLQEELDKQGKVEEKAPIEDTDYRLKSVVDETGAASQFATDELKPNETIDILSTEEEIAKLKKENAERKEKMDAGQDHPRRRAKYDETEAKIKDLETKLGGQNVGTTSTVDETDRSSVGISGQQDTTASTAGTAGTETGRVGGTTLPADLSQEGEGTKRTTLDPYKSFFNWASQNGINLPEDGETTDFPELVEQWGAETNQPQDLINELAGVEKTPTVEENKPPTNEVIDEEALAADQAKAAAAENQAVVKEEAAAELAGEVTPPASQATPPASQAKPLAGAPEKILEQKDLYSKKKIDQSKFQPGVNSKTKKKGGCC